MTGKSLNNFNALIRVNKIRIVLISFQASMSVLCAIPDFFSRDFHSFYELRGFVRIGQETRLNLFDLRNQKSRWYLLGVFESDPSVKRATATGIELIDSDGRVVSLPYKKNNNIILPVIFSQEIHNPAHLDEFGKSANNSILPNETSGASRDKASGPAQQAQVFPSAGKNRKNVTHGALSSDMLNATNEPASSRHDIIDEPSESLDSILARMKASKIKLTSGARINQVTSAPKSSDESL